MGTLWRIYDSGKGGIPEYSYKGSTEGIRRGSVFIRLLAWGNSNKDVYHKEKGKGEKEKRKWFKP